MDIQTNGVSIGAKNFANVEGDVNQVVEPGNHTITWLATESWPSNKVTLTNGTAWVGMPDFADFWPCRRKRQLL